ncbi:hypothetical protein K5I29_07915 [Flavobacterium agricola]|uniref:Uncharacterized protein n=1 Tax=Flavobacterium agricola TaxID=2870839 RepID=A0ABY6LZY1_9FLAO|nr:DUF5074 domain-containing protein [Flavobacterium agricola]UYW00478.1 hypothetical protein K5I29_07915 [Flavobacterium agricola]
MKKIFGLALVASLLFSCSSDDNKSGNADGAVNYSEGIIVLNEGNFLSTNASVSWIDKGITAIKNNIYFDANQLELGDVAQSLAFSDDLVFIVVNNSNVVEVVNKKDFKKVTTITEQLNNPRYALVENGLLYVTNSNKTITVYNTNSFTLVKTITLDFAGELLVESNNKIYVGSNPYSAGKLAIINAATQAVENTIAFDASVKGLSEENGQVYVLTSGAITTIETITNNAVSKTNTFALAGANYLVEDRDNLYFTSNLGVYEISLAQLAQNASAKELFKVADGGWSALYGFNVIDGKVFTSDANAFTEESTITIYNTSGSVLATFKGGLGTNGFYQD